MTSPTGSTPQIVVGAGRQDGQIDLRQIAKLFHHTVHFILHLPPLFVKRNRLAARLLQLRIARHKVAV